MPKNATLMAQLVKRYGAKRAEEVYAGMAASGTGPFGPKGKYREEHEAYAKQAGGPPLKGRAKKKPRPAKPKRGSRTRRRR